jgi:hypothetical protein
VFLWTGSDHDRTAAQESLDDGFSSQMEQFVDTFSVGYSSVQRGVVPVSVQRNRVRQTATAPLNAYLEDWISNGHDNNDVVRFGVFGRLYNIVHGFSLCLTL